MRVLKPCAFGRAWGFSAAIDLQVSGPFPVTWISRKWRDGYYITSLAHFETCWAIVLSKNAGLVDQFVELDFQHPSEGYLKWATEGTVPVLACNLLQICMGWRLLARKVGWQDL